MPAHVGIKSRLKLPSMLIALKLESRRAAADRKRNKLQLFATTARKQSTAPGGSLRFPFGLPDCGRNLRPERASDQSLHYRLVPLSGARRIRQLAD